MARPGDVFTVQTKLGVGVFQFVKKVRPMGSLIRVFPLDVVEKHGKDWNALVELETNFWTFFPVEAAVREGLVSKVAHCDVPVHARQTPLFRVGVPDPDTRRVSDWWLWDGEKSWRIGQITQEQRKLPIRASWNEARLRERLESGWLPEKDSW